MRVLLSPEGDLHHWGLGNMQRVRVGWGLCGSHRFQGVELHCESVGRHCSEGSVAGSVTGLGD